MIPPSLSFSFSPSVVFFSNEVKVLIYFIYIFTFVLRFSLSFLCSIIMVAYHILEFEQYPGTVASVGAGFFVAFTILSASLSVFDPTVSRKYCYVVVLKHSLQF